tara:strand:- start:15278 stop:15466 length:189 start_codon:yes stop_codon:yes gene_type:complete
MRIATVRMKTPKVMMMGFFISSYCSQKCWGARVKIVPGMAWNAGLKKEDEDAVMDYLVAATR